MTFEVERKSNKSYKSDNVEIYIKIGIKIVKKFQFCTTL